MTTMIGEAEAAASEPHWLQTVVTEGDAGFLIESAEQITYVNRAYALMLGYDSPAQLRGHHLSAIVAEEDLPRLLSFSKMRLHGLSAPRNYEFTARCRDRSLIRLRATVSAARSGPSVVIGTMVLPCDRREALVRSDSPAVLASRLSRREREVMELILAGHRMKEIALALDISAKTVSTHRTRMLKKLNLTTIRELYQYAVTHRLVEWA
ncbi:MAG TPA: LuxR C-terminal-related transcriptional regulator [Thermoanaerobaculia bacterium]